MNYKEKLLMYGGFVGKRYSQKEKEKFIRCIAKDFKDLGFETKVSTRKVRFRKIMNVYVGDMKTATNLIVVHYDTPLMQIGVDNPYYPFEFKRQEKSNSKAQIIAQAAAIAAMVFYSVLVVVPIFSDNIFNFKDILSLVGLLIILGLIFTVYKGIGNSVNFNRNTSGILMALSLAEQLSNKSNVGFVFVDMGCQSSIGYELMKHDLSKSIEQKRIYIIEPIGVGSTLGIASNSENNSMRERFMNYMVQPEIVKYVNKDADDYSSVNLFKHSIAIARGSEEDATVKILNTGTSKDTEVDFEKVEEISTVFVEMLRE